MTDPVAAPPTSSTRVAIWRLGMLVVMVAILVVVMRLPWVQAWLDVERIRLLRESLGWFGIPAYIVVFAGLIGLWVPGAILLAVGPPLFGTGLAMAVNYVTAVLGGVLGFVIARHTTGDALDALLRGRVGAYERYRRMMESRGFETILYLRLVPTPFAAVSYLAGLSPITFMQHLVATAVGILPGSLALTFLSGTLFETWSEQGIGALGNPRLLLAIALFVPVLFVPRAARHARARWGWFGGPTPYDP